MQSKLGLGVFFILFCGVNESAKAAIVFKQQYTHVMFVVVVFSFFFLLFFKKLRGES